jgi:hypothetical protein
MTTPVFLVIVMTTPVFLVKSKIPLVSS